MDMIVKQNPLMLPPLIFCLPLVSMFALDMVLSLFMFLKFSEIFDS